MKFSGKVGNGPVNKWLNFGGDPDTDPYRDTGKTCVGGGMHCPSASIVKILILNSFHRLHTHTTILRPFFRDHPGEPVPEEDFWTLWCKGRLTEADIDHPAGCHSIRTNQCPPPPSPIFTGRMPFLSPNQQCQSTEGLAHSD